MIRVFRFVRKRKKFFTCVILVWMCCIGERDKRLTITRKIPHAIIRSHTKKEDNRTIVFYLVD